MAENKNGLLFTTTDPRGYTVSLSSQQYYDHIVSTEDHQAHTEFEPAEIKECVEKPDVIYQSNSVPTSDLYYGKTSVQYPYLYLRTVVSMDHEEKKGEVVTAYLSKHMTGGGKLRYVKPKL